MGIDGLSIANLGLHKDATSAQLAAQAEAAAVKDNDPRVRDIAGLAKKEELLVKTEDKKGSSGKKDSKKKKQNKNNNTDEHFIFEDEDPKKYSIRFNEQTELIELIDNTTKSIIETITAQDLMFLVSKVKGVSGILVNKKI